MIQRKTLITAIVAVLVGGLVLGGLALAGDTGSTVSDKLADKVPFLGKIFGHGGIAASASPEQQLSEALKVVVGEHTITKEQSDKILKRFTDAEKERAALAEKTENMTLKQYREFMMKNKTKSRNPFDELISEGVITQAQFESIKASLIEVVQKQQQQQMSKGLKALVDKGTLSQEQSDKILKKYQDNKKERATILKKARAMKSAERLRFLQDNRPKDPISQLVAEGTITQKQADAIREIPAFKKGSQGGSGRK